MPEIDVAAILLPFAAGASPPGPLATNMAAMKIYTRTGDDGTTGLIGGARTAKSDLRVECYGTVDETNAAVGVAVATLPPDVLSTHADLRLLHQRLLRVQNELFVLGSHLAATDPAWTSSLPPLDDAMVARLEHEIDHAEGQLPPLKAFILPGGSIPAAQLHLARTVCRRAERLLVAFASSSPIDTTLLAYLNRLSDWLFVQARLANQLAGIEDIPWRK